MFEGEIVLAYSEISGVLSPPWWARWADPQFAHVDIWVSVGDGCYISVLPAFDGMFVALRGQEPTGIEIQRVQMKHKFGRAIFPFGPRTCVTVAKSMLGIRDWRIQTPRQLYNFVRRHNGQVG